MAGVGIESPTMGTFDYRPILITLEGHRLICGDLKVVWNRHYSLFSGHLRAWVILGMVEAAFGTLGLCRGCENVAVGRLRGWSRGELGEPVLEIVDRTT